MGVWFDDPDVEMDDIYWYSILANEIRISWIKNEGLISIDQEYNTKSCYVELHSNGELKIWIEKLLRENLKRYFFHFLSKPSGRTWWPKSYRRSDTDEVFANQGIRKPSKINRSKFKIGADVLDYENQKWTYWEEEKS